MNSTTGKEAAMNPENLKDTMLGLVAFVGVGLFATLVVTVISALLGLDLGDYPR